jgi:hypothetical protein
VLTTKNCRKSFLNLVVQKSFVLCFNIFVVFKDFYRKCLKQKKFQIENKVTLTNPIPPNLKAAVVPV